MFSGGNKNMTENSKTPVSWKLEEYAFGAVALREKLTRQQEEDKLLRNPIKAILIRLLYVYMVVVTFMLIKRQNFVYKKHNIDKQEDKDVKDELIYTDDEEAEHSIEISCPKCGKKRITTPNTGITCKGCGVRISIGDEGEIRCLYSAEK